MKMNVVLAAALLTAGLGLGSCGNSSNEKAMKVPEQNRADTTLREQDKEKGESKQEEQQENEGLKKDKAADPGVNPATKNRENLQAAYKGETTASAKYAAYAKKAEQEGYHRIALLFKAASLSENSHAANHKAVLQGIGVAVPQVKPEFQVRTTIENLQDAIAGETYEATVMYPDFLVTANASGDQLSLVSLNYAYKTEKKHKALYENALAALQNNKAGSLPAELYVCPTCGNTYDSKPPARCGISMTSGERFIKVTSI